MSDPTTTPPTVDTDPARRAELARAEDEGGVVDQQTAASIPLHDADPDGGSPDPKN